MRLRERESYRQRCLALSFNVYYIFTGPTDFFKFGSACQTLKSSVKFLRQLMFKNVRLQFRKVGPCSSRFIFLTVIYRVVAAIVRIGHDRRSS